MSDKRRGLGRGLGALIPSSTPAARPSGDRPVDVFFPDKDDEGGSVATLTAPAESETDAPTGSSGGRQSQEATNRSAASGATSAAGTAEAERASRSSNGATRDAGPRPDEGTQLVPVPGARFAEIPVGSIVPNAKQPRQVFDEEALAELVHSVREIGILQPIVVRAVPSDASGAAAYELIMGERRWRAAKLAGLDVVPAIIRDTSDDDMLRDALLENLHRSELNPLEEAAAYQQLLDDFGCTHDELAARIGRSRPQISNTIRLLKLPPQVQRRVAAGVLSAGHARALLGLEDVDAMDALALRIVAEGLSVRAVEEIVALGDGKPVKPRPKKPRAGGRQVELNDLASRLGDRLDTRVTISLGRTKGKLSVEFASVDDLNRILALISPEERRAFESNQS